MPRALLALAAPVLAIACGGDGAAGDAAVRDSTGIRIVSSPGSDVPLPWVFTEVARLGGADSGPASFTAASPALVQTDGADRITVLDRDRSRVEIFDGSGRPAGSMGRAGAGPGEFALAFQLLDVGSDQVAVFDFTKGAVVRWALDGTVLPELKPTDGMGNWNGLVLRGDTTLVGLEHVDSLRTLHRLALLVSGDTLVLDSLVAPPRGMVEFDCFAARLPPMFAPRLVWQASGGRTIVTRQSSYRIDVFDGARLVTSIRRAIEPEPSSTESARRMYPDGWRVTFGGGGGCTIDGSEVAAKAGMADRLPVVAELGFGPARTIWARRHTFPGDPPVSDVFDAEGIYLGTVTGRGVPLGWLGEDRILFPIEDEETGVTRIGIYRIDGPANEGAAPT